MRTTFLKFYFIVMSVICISSFAHAVGFYIEPGVIYESGENELEWPSPLGDSTGTSKNLGVNLNLGMHFGDIVFIGVGGSYSQGKFEHSANDYDADATSTTYSAIIGAQMPWILGLRVWGGYVFGGDLDPEESNGVDVKFEGAHGAKVGIGFKILLISLNVEYMDLKYTDSVLEKAGPVSGTIDNELSNKVAVVSVSMPFTF